MATRKQQTVEALQSGQVYLGVELGSTRIKAVLIGPDHRVIASGSHTWESCLENGYWTYPLLDVWTGIQDAYADMAAQVQEQYGQPLTRVGAMGVSAMMHGYLPFDKRGKLLTAFRTWRNTTTETAAAKLTEAFGFNIPQRWSVAHLYQAMLNGEAHVKKIDFLTTLAGYVHWQLTGKRVLGVGEASGMFPIDSAVCDYNRKMLQTFDGLAAGYPWKLRDILPKVLSAGEQAGSLTESGARLLDPSGTLLPGAPLCPPEGDAGTSMAATNSVAERTGNVSAGTSVFAMVVLEKPLSKVYPEIDLVTTPAGKPAAMVHCNTCTSDLNAWMRLFGEAFGALGHTVDLSTLYSCLYDKALTGAPDCGGLVAFNYYAGEPVTGLAEGRPLVVRRPDTPFTLGNFMRAQLYSAIATLKIGMDLLFYQEEVRLEQLTGHGGLFKTPVVAQKLMAGALNVPVTVMETASEGGPWGMALLAAYMAKREKGETLEHYLGAKVFSSVRSVRIQPDAADVQGFSAYLEHYKAALKVEKAAVEAL